MSQAIASVSVLNPDIDKARADERGLVLDVLIEHDDGSRTNVEMQSSVFATLPVRALYHWARMFRAGIARGETFAVLRPCRVIFFLA